MLRLYLDEDVRRDLLMAIRALSVDVLAAGEAQRRGLSDREQLAFATDQSRVLVTRNARDFAVLHSATIEAGDTHAGIVVTTRQRFAPGQYASALAELASQFTPDEMKNRIEFLGGGAQPT